METLLMTVKIYRETYKTLRKIAAETGERFSSLVRRLAKEEADKLKIK